MTNDGQTQLRRPSHRGSCAPNWPLFQIWANGAMHASRHGAAPSTMVLDHPGWLKSPSGRVRRAFREGEAVWTAICEPVSEGFEPVVEIIRSAGVLGLRLDVDGFDPADLEVPSVFAQPLRARGRVHRVRNPDLWDTRHRRPAPEDSSRRSTKHLPMVVRNVRQPSTDRGRARAAATDRRKNGSVAFHGDSQAQQRPTPLLLGRRSRGVSRAACPLGIAPTRPTRHRATGDPRHRSLDSRPGGRRPHP